MLDRRNITFDEVAGLKVVDMITTTSSKLVLKLPVPQKSHFSRNRSLFLFGRCIIKCACYANKTTCLLLKNIYSALDLYQFLL